MTNYIKNSFQTIPLQIAIIAVFASLSIGAEIEGTYVLENKNKFKSKNEATLTINVDDKGEYSATLDGGFDTITDAEDIEVDGNEFEATFLVGRGDLEVELTYSGRVEDGNLTGTISTSNGAEVELVGKI